MYIGHLPHLFLKEDEFKELQDLVVLSLQWLISVMKAIVGLSMEKDDGELTKHQIKQVIKNGEADLEVLEICWKGFVSPGGVIEIRHLCLILQAYCLIYPVHSITSAQVQKFIIPCMLPEIIDEATCHWRDNAPQFSFYFDFQRFLPAEIYHRLICLATRNANPSSRQQNKYSSNKCFFYNLDGTDWVMEMEPNEQKVKIIVQYESI